MGTFDCPATIDHILEQTGKEQLTYIGHSEGTSQILAAGTLMPDYFNSKINLGVLLAPPASLHNISTRIIRFESQPEMVKLIVGLLDTLNLYDILPKDFLTTGVPMIFCSYFDSQMCDLILSIFVDADPDIDITTPERFSMMLSNSPAGSGLFNYVHYA